MPLKSGEGRYVASEAVLDELEGEGRVVFRYAGSPTVRCAISPVSARPTAGVVGLMPHPGARHRTLTGPSDDGLGLFYSALDAVLV